MLEFLAPLLSPIKLGVFATSLAICAALIAAAQIIPRLSGRTDDLGAVQRAHQNLTPRLGGVAVASALCIAMCLPLGPVVSDYHLLMPGIALLFAVALAEDLGFGVSPRKRLMAAVVASALAMAMLGSWLPRADIPGLEHLVMIGVLGIPLTLFVTVGLANAFNLIDGVNGLAAVTSLVALCALGVIADQIARPDIVRLCQVLFMGVLGFLVFNYPKGRIFLGHSGAYGLGFVLAWIRILILLASPVATPWAILLTLFWPVADTALAIYRRRQRGVRAMQPDRLHVHQLVMRALEIHVLGRDKRHISNPLTTLILTPFIITPAIFGVILYNNPLLAGIAVIVFGLLFTLSYVIGVRFTRAPGNRQRS